MAIVNIRGTSGSGKSTIVHDIIKMADLVEPISIEGQKKLEGYRIAFQRMELPIYIVGSYANVCGGCDGISTQDEICRRIRAYALLGHVLVEGLLMSNSFSRYAALDRELHDVGIPFIWAFMDTPLEVCLERVNARRKARGVEEAVNPVNTTNKWHGVKRCAEMAAGGHAGEWKEVRKIRPSALAAKLDVRWVPYQDATKTVMGWLEA